MHTAFVTRFRALKVTLRESTGQCGSLHTKIIEIGPRSSENGPFEVCNYWIFIDFQCISLLNLQ